MYLNLNILANPIFKKVFAILEGSSTANNFEFSKKGKILTKIYEYRFSNIFPDLL